MTITFTGVLKGDTKDEWMYYHGLIIKTYGIIIRYSLLNTMEKLQATQNIRAIPKFHCKCQNDGWR